MDALNRMLTSLLHEGVMNYEGLSSVTGLTISYCQQYTERLHQQGLVRIMPFGGREKTDVVVLLTPHGKLTAAKLNPEVL
ncbi:hypothetical protein GCM10023187_41170 [Nibrella viscosa]|uniref:Uncharacterized protein n=1 Tax=Nibrella viscosa TaxID=1084524 RepID=A0ABP8KS50_9BACT